MNYSLLWLVIVKNTKLLHNVIKIFVILVKAESIVLGPLELFIYVVLFLKRPEVDFLHGTLKRDLSNGSCLRLVWSLSLYKFALRSPTINSLKWLLRILEFFKEPVYIWTRILILRNYAHICSFSRRTIKTCQAQF